MTETSEKRTSRKVRTGRVISAKAAKTIVVEVERLVRHPLYKRIIKRRTRLHAHDEASAARAGDLVKVMETRPLSKTKRWRLVDFVERSKDDT